MSVNNSLNLNLSSQTSKGRNVLAGYECLSDPPEQLRTCGGYRMTGADGNCFYLTDDMLSTGLMINGSTGSGKSNTLTGLLNSVIPGMKKSDVMIILDSKGDYRRRYFQPDNPDHLLFSLKEEDQSVSVVWNIFRELRNRQGVFTSRSLSQNTWKMAQALFRGLESSAQPFFSMAASDFLSKILCSCVRDKTISRQLNTSVLNNLLASGPDVLCKLIRQFPEYRYLDAYVGDNTSNQALGVWGFLMCMKARSIEPLDFRGNGGSLGIREFIRNKGGKILFLEYDVEYADTLSVLYSLFYDLAIQEALVTEGGNKYFICEEANLLPYVQNLVHLLNVGRSYGCKTIFCMQSMAMLQNHYSEAQAQAIAAGFCNMISFQNCDSSTRNFVKQRLGETFDVYNYGGEHITNSSYTVSDADLRSLPVGRAIVDIKGYPVFSFQFAETK